MKLAIFEAQVVEWTPHGTQFTAKNIIS